MASIGNRTLNLFTVSPDAVRYAGPTNTISHKDVVDVRRELPSKAADPLRSNLRFERGFAVPTAEGVPSQERSVTVSVAVIVPPGVDTNAVKAFVNDTLVQAATVAGSIAVSGDVHLD